jgi:hypothetical protein
MVVGPEIIRILLVVIAFLSSAGMDELFQRAAALLESHGKAEEIEMGVVGRTVPNLDSAARLYPCKLLDALQEY